MKTRKVKVNNTPRFIPNPEYEGSETQKEEALSQAWTLNDYYTFQPDECNSDIPKEGCWIMVKKSPPTDFTVPPLSMWYAFDDPIPRGNSGLTYHRARILTPKGDLWLWPAEYTKVKDISVYFGFKENEVHIILLGGEGVNSESLFYLRSRGISKADAIKMLLGEVKSQNVAFITFHPDAVACFTRDYDMPKPDRLAFQEEWK